MKLTALDKAISWVSPSAGLKRMRYRQALDVALSYDGGRNDARTGGWVTSNGSVNSDIGTALVTMRRRSRDLVQNNPYAARILRVIQTDAVGTGITPRADSNDPKLNEKADALWEKHQRACNADNDTPFSAQQGMVVRALIESGEALVRFRDRRADDGLPVPLQYQLLESDHLDTARTMQTPTGYIVQGVQFNLRGQREGYWIFPLHPGDSFVPLRTGFASQFVPAAKIRHIYEPLRPGQIRGVPWFAPVILKFRDLAEYDEAELVRKKIESCLAAFVTQPEGEDGAPLGKRATDSAGNRTEDFRPGMIEYLKPGEDIKLGSPSSSSVFSDYWVQQLRGLAVGMNVMYEQATGDLSTVNYSSFRGGMMVYRPFIEMLRWNVIIPMFCDPAWSTFTQAAWAAGLLPQAEIPVKWTAPQFQSVDPKKDAEADQANLRNGGLEWGEYVSGKGFDPKKQLEAIKFWNGEFDKAGVVLDIDPRKTDASGKPKGDINAQNKNAAAA